jgi:GAF domain-containing protein
MDPAATEDLLRAHERARADLARATVALRELVATGVRLAAERDLDTRLEVVLTQARDLTWSDAGILYLVEAEDGGGRRLRVALAQSGGVPLALLRAESAVGPERVVGYVALTGEVVNVPDADRLREGAPFTVDRAFDRQTGYRTASTLVVPRKSSQGKAQGVLQLVNRRPEPAWRFASPAAMVREAVPSPARSRDLAVALAALGAVAPENSRRYAGGRAALAAVDASQRRIIQSERLWVEDPLVRGQREIIDGAQTVRRTQEVARMRRMWPFRTVDLAKPLDLDEAAVDEGAVRVEETLARAAPAGG